ncbi:MAG: hypothetical protein ABI823_09285 [Bryobacteraceae bacterium]
MGKFVRIMWLPVMVAALYTAWVMWQRHADDSASGPAIERDPMAAYGTSVKILQFYAAAKEVAPGGKVLICYGVVNAAAVRLDPPVEKVWPAVSRCFEAAPSVDTRYTLTAEAADHKTVSESFEIAVRR